MNTKHTLADFLAAFVPGRWDSERLPVYKRFLAHDIRADKRGTAFDERHDDPLTAFSKRPVTTADEINAAIIHRKLTGFSEHEWHNEARFFQIWQARTAKAASVEKGRAGAKKRARNAADKKAS